MTSSVLQWFPSPAQRLKWCVYEFSQTRAVRKVHQAVKRRSKRSRTPRRTWWVIKPSDTCPIKWLPFVSPERNHQSNIIVKNRIIFRQKLRDEKTSEEDQENIEIYVVHNTFDLWKLISFLERLQISSFPWLGTKTKAKIKVRLVASGQGLVESVQGTCNPRHGPWQPRHVILGM